MRADAESNDNRGQPCQPMNLLPLADVPEAHPGYVVIRNQKHISTVLLNVCAESHPTQQTNEVVNITAE